MHARQKLRRHSPSQTLVRLTQKDRMTMYRTVDTMVSIAASSASSFVASTACAQCVLHSQTTSQTICERALVASNSILEGGTTCEAALLMRALPRPPHIIDLHCTTKSTNL